MYSCLQQQFKQIKEEEQQKLKKLLSEDADLHVAKINSSIGKCLNKMYFISLSCQSVELILCFFLIGIVPFVCQQSHFQLTLLAKLASYFKAMNVGWVSNNFVHLVMLQ